MGPVNHTTIKPKGEAGGHNGWGSWGRENHKDPLEVRLREEAGLDCMDRDMRKNWQIPWLYKRHRNMKHRKGGILEEHSKWPYMLRREKIVRKIHKTVGAEQSGSWKSAPRGEVVLSGLERTSGQVLSGVASLGAVFTIT